MNARNAVFCGTLAASLSLGFPLHATSITGGGETVETTPTPNQGFKEAADPIIDPEQAQETEPMQTRSGPLPTATPVKTPEVEKTPEPDNLRTIMRDARQDFREKDFDAALEKVRKAEGLTPGTADLLNFRGAIYAETGRYPEAIKLYRKALELNENSFWPAFNIGEVDFIQHKYVEARKHFQEMMGGKFPNHELLRFKIVLTYLLQENPAAAQAEIEKFTFPANSAAREFSMAALEFARKSPDKAKEWMDSGVRIFGFGRTDFLYRSLADLNWVPAERDLEMPLPAKKTM